MGSSSRAGARRRRVAIIADAVAETQERIESATASSLDDVRDTLARQGFEPVVLEFAGEPASWLRALREGEFDLVFNLCEGLGGQGSEEHLPAAAVELLGLPMTGARALTLGLCLRKDLVNAHLRAVGIAVPDWTVSRPGEALAWRRYPAIVKPAAEDASLGIDDRSVVHDGAELEAARARAHQSWPRVLVQRFIEGRELNLALVGNHVLPHAEIEWALPDGLPHVVTYAAKWDTGSVYDRGTVPRLLGAPEERLSARLSALARRVWAAVDGVGYARIDVRMDERGRAWVIDVNPNPDLTPNAGLARQAAAAGWSYPDLIAHIVEAAFDGQSALSRVRGARRAEVPV
jgi:D-alanine-D-alanine ligase